MRPLLLALLAALLVSSPGWAGPQGADCPELAPTNSWTSSAVYPTEGIAGITPAAVKARRLLSLRREGLTLQTQDGGRLSSAHRSALQEKLNAIEAGDFQAPN